MYAEFTALIRIGKVILRGHKVSERVDFKYLFCCPLASFQVTAAKEYTVYYFLTGRAVVELYQTL